MAITSLAERRSILAADGETFVFPGGVEIAGTWQAPTTDDLDVRGSAPGATFTFEDVEHFKLETAIWRKSKGKEYVVKDIELDGFEGFTFYQLEFKR